MNCHRCARKIDLGDDYRNVKFDDALPKMLCAGCAAELGTFLDGIEQVRSHDKVAWFLYLLMRDHLTPGKVEEILVKNLDVDSKVEAVFSNPHLARYAIEIAARLRTGPADIRARGRVEQGEVKITQIKKPT